MVQRDHRDLMITDESDLSGILDEAKIEMALGRMDEHYLAMDTSIPGYPTGLDVV